jgi:hypothetical protein
MPQLSGGEHTEFPETQAKPLPISKELQAKFDKLRQEADTSGSAEVDRTMADVFRIMEESTKRQ